MSRQLVVTALILIILNAVVISAAPRSKDENFPVIAVHNGSKFGNKLNVKRAVNYNKHSQAGQEVSIVKGILFEYVVHDGVSNPGKQNGFYPNINVLVNTTTSQSESQAPVARAANYPDVNLCVLESLCGRK